MQALGSGSTLRDLATSDPSVLGDTAFLKFVQTTKEPAGFEEVLDEQGRPIAQRGPQGRTFAHPLAPEPEGPAAEMFEDVQNPFGQGGFGQRSSTTGKMVNYHGAPSQTPERERRTAKDRFGRLRYLDTEAPAFSDKTLGPEPEAAKPEVPLKDKLQMVRSLSRRLEKNHLANAKYSGLKRPNGHRPSDGTGRRHAGRFTGDPDFV